MNCRVQGVSGLPRLPSRWAVGMLWGHTTFFGRDLCGFQWVYSASGDLELLCPAEDLPMFPATWMVASRSKGSSGKSLSLMLLWA